MGSSHHDVDLKASDPKTSMENQAYEMVKTMEKLLADNDPVTAWNLQSSFVRVHNAQPRNSAEREAMAAVWKKAMDRWH
jgi:hypothetical protein